MRSASFLKNYKISIRRSSRRDPKKGAPHNSKTAVHLELRLPPPESRSLVSYADMRCDFGLAEGAWEKKISSRMFRG